MSILISLLIVVVVLWLVFYLLGTLPIAEPFGTVIKVIAVVASVIYLITHFL